MIVEQSLPILVVDDYKTMVRIIRTLLGQIGFTDIDEASSGAEALEKMHDKSYGLIISDWNMEPMTGSQLLQKVRENKDVAEVPFIKVTAESKNRQRNRCAQSGGKPLHRQAVQRHDTQSQNRLGFHDGCRRLNCLTRGISAAVPEGAKPR